MQKEFEKEYVRVNHRKCQRLRTYKDTSFVSNNESNNEKVIMGNPQTVDFEEYLYTEHYSPSDDYAESLAYNEADTDSQPSNDEERSDSLLKNQKILIEMGQNYTFADQMSSHRKGNKKQVNLKCFPSMNKKLFYFGPSSQRNANSKLPQLKLSSCSSLEIPYQSNFSLQSSTSKEISLSDNQEDQGVTIYKTKQIEEEMFLKISEQAKEILRLQQKTYYFEDFCKRLLKSQEESSKVKNKLALQLKDLKKKSKAKSSKIKELEAKLLTKEQEIKSIKQSSAHLLHQYRSNPRSESLTKRQVERKVFLEKQNFQNITILQSENKILNEKYQIMLSKYEQMESKVFNLQGELLKHKKDLQVMRKKNLNIQNMNRILEKQISELNIKIFQMENQMQKVTYDKYASNLIRIKNFNTEGSKDPNLRKSPLITEAFEAQGSLSLKRT